LQEPGQIDEYARAATLRWEKELTKIQIDTSDAERATAFYTALYRTCLAPVIGSDRNGEYKTYRDQLRQFTNGKNKYTIFSQWDVFRALHPLFSITQPERHTDMLQSMMAFYEDNGLLPVWDISSWEANTMTGYHSIPILADSIIQGNKSLDPERAYMAMKKSALQNQRGTPDYIKYGYLPQDKHGWSVTITLEYAYDDWCIAQVAKKLGKTEDHALFMKRAASYKNLFDSTTGFFRSKNSQGKFIEPFDPLLSEHGFDGQYIEGTAWQHSFFVPHDVTGFAQLHGGPQALIAKLDQLFSASSELHGDNVSIDVTGLIGQYAHGNEPSHHIIYLYTALGAPEKAARWIQVVADSMYKTGPDGLTGNDDCGQMSAWYVMSAMGIYPVCPGTDRYALTTPLFNKITIAAKTPFVISCDKDPLQSPYIHTAQLNGTPHPYSGISHTDIMKGGTLHFMLQKSPVSEWGKETGDPSIPQEVLPEIAPIIKAPAATFVGSMSIEIIGTPEQQLEYALNDGDWQPYTTPLVIREKTHIRARAWDPVSKRYSSIVSGNYVSIPKHYNIEYITHYNNQYTGGGELALIDGLHGNTDFRTGQWQGWWGEDMVIEIDLGEVRSIQEAGGMFLQDVRSWIWMPSAVEISVSKNGKDFTPAATIAHSIRSDQYDSKETAALSATFTPVNARYVRIRAVNFGPVPEWHPGKGGKTWVFCDEVWVR